MLKKTIKYENLDGETVSKEFYFNITAAELAEMAIDGATSLGDDIRAIMNSDDPRKILPTFKRIIEMAVGVRVGDQFIKDDRSRGTLMNTGAFDELFLELMSDAGAAVQFIKGVVPASVVTRVEKKVAEEGLVIEGWDQPVRSVETVEVDLAAAPQPKATVKALHEMSLEELIELKRQVGT